MIIFVMCSFLFALVIGVVTKLTIDSFKDQDFRVFEKKKYKTCDILLKTAKSEEECYGGLVSGSIINHISSCNYCQYVRDGDVRKLEAHRAEMEIIRREWK